MRNDMNHEPECTYYVEIYVSEYETVFSDCICDILKSAYERGRKDEIMERAAKFGAWHDYEIEKPW